MYILKFESKKHLDNWQMSHRIVKNVLTFDKFEEFLAKYRELVENQGYLPDDPNYTNITTEKVKEVEAIDLDKFL